MLFTGVLTPAAFLLRSLVRKQSSVFVRDWYLGRFTEDSARVCVCLRERGGGNGYGVLIEVFKCEVNLINSRQLILSPRTSF